MPEVIGESCGERTSQVNGPEESKQAGVYEASLGNKVKCQVLRVGPDWDIEISHKVRLGPKLRGLRLTW